MTDFVDHPFVPNWQAPGGSLSEFLAFEAGDDGAPFKIEHGRDMMFDNGELVQDYNFIDYFFGDAGSPTTARHYLGDNEVSVRLTDLPDDATLGQARSIFPATVLKYLQRRFESIRVLTRDGYSMLWPAAND